MAKILSIIIPSYNMEKLLGRCIESLLPDKLNNIEIIIVNDGSKDNTLLVANEYKGNYPDVIVVIDKPNGNYGSCINEGLKVAKGKYIKILDADDWFDSKAFKEYILVLEKTDVDLILTDFNDVIADGPIIKRHCENLDPYKVLSSTHVFESSSFLKLGMHAVTYRTKILRDNNYKQTEGISYTDQEWIFYPMEWVQKVFYCPLNVYQYNLGREGQTMDPKIIVRNISHFIQILERMLDTLSHKEFSNEQKKYLYNCMRGTLKTIYKNVLLNDNIGFDLKTLSNLDHRIKYMLPLYYKEMDDFVIHKYLPLKYIYYWRRKQKRYPNIVLQLNKNLKLLQKKFEYYRS
ncbi:hypothetical protein SAMN05660493_02252 [Epilithonimonas bovis DSM 19482]|uniref:Glycosyltransferase 2-like domain-containing protein n=1 Tax=Epilithonimonas bovis DSM 19482 TaxID=1121284 RepID=A0A1U7PZN7_9FLAO|nr:glycosyltransferase [Epilithonimonas bovis]SIT97532.1 hypothetical protein SAMN05660493_02252 [Epilithonimonas bovis DSM 19482]